MKDYDYISDLPVEILGNIMYHLNIEDVMNFMTTSKINYNKVNDVLNSPLYFQLGQYFKYHTYISINDICQTNNLNQNNSIEHTNEQRIINTKTRFLPYIYIDIDNPDEEIPLIENTLSKNEKQSLSLYLYKISDFNYNTQIFNNLVDLIFYKVNFCNDFQFDNIDVDYIEFNKCLITNNTIKQINSVNTLVITNCSSLTSYDNNVKCDKLLFEECKNLNKIDNVNCNIIEINGCGNNINYQDLNNKGITKLQIVNANMIELADITIPNISIIDCNISYIHNFKGLERIKILNSNIFKVFSIKNCNKLIIDNCLVSNNSIISISHITNINEFSMEYLTVDNYDISNIPKVSITETSNIKSCNLKKVKIATFKIKKCDNLEVKLYKDIDIEKYISSKNLLLTDEQINKLMGLEFENVNSIKIEKISQL